MPQKLNKAGKMQDYIPAGNGDASGEYGTSNGTNKNFTTSDKKSSKANVITENKSVVVENKSKKEKEKPFDIDTIDVSLRKKVESGEITLKDASKELAKAGWYNFIPSEEETKKALGIKDNKANIIDDDLTGKKKYDDSDIRNMDESEFDGIVSTKKLWEEETKKYEEAKPVLDKMGIKIEDVKWHIDSRTKDMTDNISTLVYKKTGTYSGRNKEEEKAISSLIDKVYIDRLTREFKIPKKTNKIS